jgi:hypothetical protein
MGLQSIDMSPYKAIEITKTFGHLAPKPQTEFNGFILFTLTCFGDTCIIEFIFDGLKASPCLNVDILEFISSYTNNLPADKNYGVYRFEGSYKKFKNGNHKFRGQVKEEVTN